METSVGGESRKNRDEAEEAGRRQMMQVFVDFNLIAVRIPLEVLSE